MRLLNQCINNCFRIFLLYLRQHYVARMTLHQCGDMASVGASDQITFPVTRNCAIFCRGRPLPDGHSVSNFSQAIIFLGYLGGGRIPPVTDRIPQMELKFRANRRSMDFSDSPRCDGVLYTGLIGSFAMDSVAALVWARTWAVNTEEMNVSNVPESNWMNSSSSTETSIALTGSSSPMKSSRRS